jgi:ketosteroid isomerase-like protein
MSHDLKQITEHWFEEVWNRGNRNVIDEMFPPECILHDGAVDIAGPEMFKAQYDSMQTVLSGIHFQPEVILTQGDHVVARWVVTAKHRASGRDVRFTGLTLMRFQDGKPAEGWQNWDLHGLIEQVRDVPVLAMAQTAS